MTSTDTHQMVLIHRACRRESRLLVDLVAAVAPGDTARASVLATHLRGYRADLCQHQHGQDELLWPLLLARVDLDADLVLRMRAQTDQLAATLADIDAALPGWAATAGEDERDRLVADLVRHRVLLARHLDEEEADVLPLAARHLTSHEWRVLTDRFVTDLPLARLLAYLGAVLADANRTERAAVLCRLSAWRRIAWHLLGKPLHRRRIRRIRR